MKKSYRVGFTAGTFDMFHIGHLNLLKRAKEKCDYLIVGVNNDSLVEKYKNKRPVINVESRLAIIEALTVVDKVAIMNNLDKIDAHSKFHFDVVFIGDDWKGSERWIATEKNLNEINVDVCYLNYTKGVSSTQIVDKITNMGGIHVS